MDDYRAVRSTLDMSKSIAFYLEMSDPAGYPPEKRAGTVRAVNDILQGRSDLSLDMLHDLLEQKCTPYYAGEISAMWRDINSFMEQKALRSRPYNKSSSKTYHYRTYDRDPERPLKIINQQTFDRAAKAGFPPGFFRESYFDQVTVYCLPDWADLNFSVFQSCHFAVCRINGAAFDGASIYDSRFHSVAMEHTTFFQATLAHTHFQDSGLTLVSFQKARLKSCNTMDCTLEHISYQDATLDGCAFGRVKARNIHNLLTANITQGGATEEECRQNRAAVLRTLAPDKAQAPVRQREAVR